MQNNFNKITMWILALYPILWIYQSPLFFNWGDLLLIILMLFKLFKYKKNILIFPSGYFLYWGYLAISFVLLTLMTVGFKAGMIIPGGFSFFIFSIIIGFLVPCFDIDIYRKCFRKIFIISVIIFVAQEVMFANLGYRFAALLPFGKLYDGTSTQTLIYDQIYYYRSSSFFREPAHYAQFLLLLLAIELFNRDSINKLFTKYALFIIVILLILRSGNGFIGIIFLCLIKFLYFMFYVSHKSISLMHKLFILSISVITIIFSVLYYINTEVGQNTMSRVSEMENNQDALSYIRIYRGFALYSEMPFINKLIGMTNNSLISFIPQTSLSILFRGDNIQSDLYFNGIQNILISSGFLGLLLFFTVYLKLLRGNDILSKIIILLFLILSFLSQTFLSHIMIIATVISTYSINKRRYYDKNILLHKT